VSARKTGKAPETYEFVVLGALHREFPFSKKEEAETLIRKRLKRKKLGAYDQARVDLLRRFKDEVQEEVCLRPDGPNRKSRYFSAARPRHDYSDFDIPRMTADMIAKYPDIPRKDVEWFVHFAVGTYYLL
jgi:hypothetical protein